MLATTFKNFLSVSEDFNSVEETIEAFRDVMIYLHVTEMPKIGEVSFIVMKDMSVVGVSKSGKLGIFEPGDRCYDEALMIIKYETMKKAGLTT